MTGFKRHDMGMHMSSSTMDMMASTTTSSMSMSTSSSAMDMSDMDHLDSMMTMAMYFQSSYKDVPVVFKSLVADDGAKAFGIFMLILFIGILTRGLEFLRNYLEQKVWKNQNYITNGVKCDLESDDSKSDHVITRTIPKTTTKDNIPSMLIRNFIRLVLCFLPEMLAFALMLAAMTFTPVYFFAVVTGLALGRFIFDRLSDRLRVQPIGTDLHH